MKTCSLTRPEWKFINSINFDNLDIKGLTLGVQDVDVLSISNDEFTVLYDTVKSKVEESTYTQWAYILEKLITLKPD